MINKFKFQKNCSHFIVAFNNFFHFQCLQFKGKKEKKQTPFKQFNESKIVEMKTTRLFLTTIQKTKQTESFKLRYFRDKVRHRNIEMYLGIQLLRSI